MSKCPPICPYCGNKSILTSSGVVYGGRDFGPIYLCRCIPELAYVGCHKGTTVPLGRLANKELREWKKRTHGVLDPIWRDFTKSRSDVYRWLASELGIQQKDCHVGMFDVDTCKIAYEICSKRLESLRLKEACNAD